MKKSLLPLMVTAATISSSFAGVAIPDTRRDQTWVNRNVAASSFKVRNNASLSYDSYVSDDGDDETTWLTSAASVITRVDAFTIEAQVSSDEIDYGDDDKETDKTLYVGGAYQIGESLSLGLQFANYTQDEDDDYNEVSLGAVYKLAGEHYLGLNVQQKANAAGDNLDYNTYSVAYGRRSEMVDYEAALTFIAEDENDEESVAQSTQLSLLAVARFDALELTGNLIHAMQSEDSDFADDESTQTYIFLRPEYMINKELYVGGQLIYMVSSFEDNEDDDSMDGTFNQLEVFGRYIIQDSVQLYASYGAGSSEYDWSESDDTDSDRQVFQLKASYLW